MTPLDPFAPDAAERLAFAGAGPADSIPINGMVWNAPRLRSPSGAKWKPGIHGWTASIVPSDLIAVLVFTVVLYFVLNTMAALILIWFETELQELLMLLGLNALLLAIAFPMCHLWLLLRMPRCVIIRVCVDRTGETELTRKRLFARTTPKMDRPVFALAANTSPRSGLWSPAKRIQFELLACDSAAPRALIAVAHEAATLLDLVKSMPQEVLDNAEFLLIDRPVINPTSN
ncbi:MAG: hypothetical protein JJU33_01825 [Phycisphaerales bacterium]|nr:hypothetical protein [Phycisphaerales bacterium]